MDNSKKKITEILIFLFFLLFPFGQLFSFSLKAFGTTIRAHPIDAVVLFSAVFVLFALPKIPAIYKDIKNFLYALGFSLLYSLTFFSPGEITTGVFYLLRIVAYSLFFLLVLGYLDGKKERKKFVFNLMLSVLFFVMVFGFWQYFVYPDFRPFKVWNWDDHLYRFVGTFLDPGFTSIILVFGFLASALKFLEKKKAAWFLSSGLLLVAIALTFSRAGYIALFAGTGVLFLVRRGITKVVPLLIAFALILYLIPRPAGEGVNLARTYSIFARVESYQQALKLTRRSPIFGVGYNNLCIAKDKFLGEPVNFDSHSCSGVESSWLLILATSGGVGLSIFIYLIKRLSQSISKDIYGQTFMASGVALLTHSLFVNSLFYPWVMGYLGVMLALALKEKSSP